MTSPGPRVARIENDRGAAGSVVLTSLVGTGLAGVTAVSLSGAGAVARIRRRPRAGRIELSIAIAADAAPGPRTIRLAFAGRRGAGGAAPDAQARFHVLARTSYSGMGGIGADLI
jgi:hypothetical protein